MSRRVCGVGGLARQRSRLQPRHASKDGLDALRDFHARGTGTAGQREGVRIYQPFMIRY